MSDNVIKITSEMGKRWKEERKRLRLKQSDMDYLLGYESEGKNYGRIERGEQGVRKNVIQNIADILDVDIEYLMCDPLHPYRNEADRILQKKQALEERKKAFHNAWNESAEKGRKAKENNEPWAEFVISHGDKYEMLVNCNKQPVSKLIASIIRNGGYGLILDGLRELENYIKID